MHTAIFSDHRRKHNMRDMDSLSRFDVSSLRLGRVVTMLEDDAAASPAGKCDGCGATDVPLMKISLGHDFFGRVYDRLSPSADVSPKWYCDACSVEKNLQRDFRDIKGEFDKLAKGADSALGQTNQLERATLRVKEIAAMIAANALKQALLKPEEVSVLARSLETRRAAAKH